MSNLSTAAILEIMQNVADEKINPRFQSLTEGDIDQKTPGDFVTVADREAEIMLADELRACIPGCTVIGEEGIFDDLHLLDSLADAEHMFVIDPIDGTGNFVNGSPKFGIMLAEVRAGDVTRSWIWQPQLGHAYVAEKGAGAYKDGVRLEPQPLHKPPFGVSSRGQYHDMDADGELQPISGTNLSAAIDYAVLIEGGYDFILYRNAKPWDHLPGSLMVREIGGAVIDRDGAPYGPATEYMKTIIAARSADVAELARTHLIRYEDARAAHNSGKN